MPKKTPCFLECFDESIPKESFDDGFITSYQNDFKKYCNATRKSYTFDQKRKEDPPKIISRPYEREDPETFAKFTKGSVVPIELQLRPKPIIRTNPHIPFKVLSALPEASKEEAIKTRPRLYMVPQIPLDDIKEQEMRQRLCAHTYTTQGRKVEKEATAYWKRIIPPIDKIETTDKVALKHDYMPPLAEKFRKAGREWDHDQVRGDPDATKDFWLTKDPPVICGACVDPYKNIVPEDVQKELKRLVKENKLVAAHDMKPGCTYTGFLPRLPMGIALERKKLSTLHPLLSVSQALTSRTPEEVAKLAKILETKEL